MMELYEYNNTPPLTRVRKRTDFDDDIVEVFIRNLYLNGLYTFDEQVIRDSWDKFKNDASKDLALLHGFRDGDELILPYAYKTGFVASMDLNNGNIIDIPFTRNTSATYVKSFYNNEVRDLISNEPAIWKLGSDDTVGYLFEEPISMSGWTGGNAPVNGNVNGLSLASPNVIGNNGSSTSYYLGGFVSVVRFLPQSTDNWVNRTTLRYFVHIPSNANFYINFTNYLHLGNRFDPNDNIFGNNILEWEMLKDDWYYVVVNGGNGHTQNLFPLIVSKDSSTNIMTNFLGFSMCVWQASLLPNRNLRTSQRKILLWNRFSTPNSAGKDYLQTVNYQNITTHSEVSGVRVGRNTDPQELVQSDKVYAIILKR